MNSDQFIAELWSYAAEVPMEQHPWFDGIIKHRWSKEQIVLGEVQHYLRVRTNPIFFGHMAINAVSAKEYTVMQTVLETSCGNKHAMSVSGATSSKPACGKKSRHRMVAPRRPGALGQNGRS